MWIFFLKIFAGERKEYISLDIRNSKLIRILGNVSKVYIYVLVLNV